MWEREAAGEKVGARGGGKKSGSGKWEGEVVGEKVGMESGSERWWEKKWEWNVGGRSGWEKVKKKFQKSKKKNFLFSFPVFKKN